MQDIHDEFINYLQSLLETHYIHEIETLTAQYPDIRSLYLDWNTINEYDEELADDFINHPGKIQEFTEEALRLQNPDAELDQAHIRIKNLPNTTTPTALTSNDADTLVSVKGWVKTRSNVQTKLTEGAFECQLCGTDNIVPQRKSERETPNQCIGCERNTNFEVVTSLSTFTDIQTGVITDLANPTATRPDTLPVELTDDLAGTLTQGTPVKLTGILRLKDTDSNHFEKYLDVESIETLGETDWEQWRTTHLGTEITSSKPTQSDLEDFVHRSRQVITEMDYIDETNMQAKILTPFLHLLGWNIYSPEVQLEYSGDVDDIDDRADYALFDTTKNPAVMVEAKRVTRPLEPYISQLQKYMRLFGAEWGLLSNGTRYIILKAQDTTGKPEEKRVLDCELEELLDNATTLRVISREQFP